jgi:hypothetical protein
MIIAASQPYFAPHAGFFYKACICECLVLLDNVQFRRGTTWITRNRFKNDQGTLWLTIPVWKKGLGLQKIGAVRICHEGKWARKHVESLKHAYHNAPFFDEHLAFLEKIFTTEYEKIIDLNVEIIRYILDILELDTRLIKQSELGATGKGDRLLISVCRQMGATDFTTQGAARKYIDGDVINRAGITIKYFSPPTLIYPQLWGKHIDNLSIFDMIFNCGLKARDILLGSKL